MSYLLYGFLFALGIVMGSFLNVVALRYKPSKFLFDYTQIGGRSHCPICKKELVWYELIPLVSFLVQGGRCRHCRHAISYQYPIVELLSGLIFVLVPMYFAQTYNLSQVVIAGQDVTWFYGLSLIWTFAFFALLMISVIDFHQYLIPNELNVFLGILGVGAIVFTRGSFLGFYAPMLELSPEPWIGHVAGAVIAFIFFSLIILLTRGKAMGMGDLKLAAALGLLFGWPDIIMVALVAFVIGSLASIRLLFTKKKSLKDAVPFGPFLAIAAFVVFLFGFQILRAYFNLFGL